MVLSLPALSGCDGDPSVSPKDPPAVDRHAAIPATAVKGDPVTDLYPPILHSSEFEQPVPVPVINTAGGEDAPFIPAHRDEMFFFFGAVLEEDPALAIQDAVNGIWNARRVGGEWQEPTLVWLQDYDEPALNGCPVTYGDEIYFCTARAPYAGPQWFRAERVEGAWGNWAPLDFPKAFEVGEMHLQGDELYFGSRRGGGQGGEDIWYARQEDGVWGAAVNLAVVNTPADESRPYMTPGGGQLWFTRTYQGSPAVFRSIWAFGDWQPPELILSQFAGEPTLDDDGNVYFVHHFYRDGVMQDADIYVARRKPF